MMVEPLRLSGLTVTQVAARARQLRPGMISEHFALSEFACKCGRWPTCTHARPVPELLLLLEAARAMYYSDGLRVLSGVRCAAHNRGIGGAKSSQHLVGRAADLKDPRMTVSQAKRLGAKGIGWDEGSGLVSHLDVRPGPVTVWMYPKGVRG